jgi:hypothetical protein
MVQHDAGVSEPARIWRPARRQRASGRPQLVLGTACATSGEATCFHNHLLHCAVWHCTLQACAPGCNRTAHMRCNLLFVLQLGNDWEEAKVPCACREALSRMAQQGTDSSQNGSAQGPHSGQLLLPRPRSAPGGDNAGGCWCNPLLPPVCCRGATSQRW